MADYAQINNNRAAAAGQYGARTQSSAPKGHFCDVLKAQENSARTLGNNASGSDPADKPGRNGAGPEDPKDGNADYGKQLKEHMEEMIDRIKNGTIQPKIAIGAQEYTQEEWKKLLEKFDDAEADLEEQLKEQIEALKEQAKKEQADRSGQRKEDADRSAAEDLIDD